MSFNASKKTDFQIAFQDQKRIEVPDPKMSMEQNNFIISVATGNSLSSKIIEKFTRNFLCTCY